MSKSQTTLVQTLDHSAKAHLDIGFPNSGQAHLDIGFPKSGQAHFGPDPANRNVSLILDVAVQS